MIPEPSSTNVAGTVAPRCKPITTPNRIERGELPIAYLATALLYVTNIGNISVVDLGSMKRQIRDNCRQHMTEISYAQIGTNTNVTPKRQLGVTPTKKIVILVYFRLRNSEDEQLRKEVFF